MKFVAVICISFFLLSAFGQNRYTEIRLESEKNSEFDILEDTLDNFRVYFTGENHMYASFNTQFEVKFLKYLHRTQGVKHFIFEQSPALGYIVNQITIHGRSKYKLYLKDKFFDPFYQMVKSIEKFNDTLAMEDKVRFHGIDIERFPYFSMYALNEMVEDKSSKFKGGEVFEQIMALASSDLANASADMLYPESDDLGFTFGEISGPSTLRSLIKTSYDNKDSISIQMGNDSTIFFRIIESLEHGIEWYNAEKRGDVKSPIIRERFMADEFERIYNRSESDEKFYGQFGRCHIHKNQRAGRCYDYYLNSIANRINEIDSSLENRVLVIPIFYSQSKNYDGRIIKDLRLEDKFLEEGFSFLIDLRDKGGMTEVTGFYNDLPYIIICNREKDDFEQYNLKWEEPKTHYHLGFYYGYNYFTKFSGLNFELASADYAELENRMTTYTWSIDIISVKRAASKISFTYFAPIDNKDSIELGGYKFTLGGSYPFGNEFFSTAVGMNFGYGIMSMTETSDNTVPNLIQSGGQNKVVYRNDYFVVDPMVELRITMPIVSMNLQTGYAFDLSGKYWKLDEKLKNFRKTSFSSFYFQFGLSFHLGIED